MTSCLARCHPDRAGGRREPRVPEAQTTFPFPTPRSESPAQHPPPSPSLFSLFTFAALRKKALPGQTQRRQPWLASAGITVSQKQFSLCVRFTQRRLFLLNDYHDTREFLITAKLEWAGWILKRWRSTSALTRISFEKILLQQENIRCFRRFPLTSII